MQGCFWKRTETFKRDTILKEEPDESSGFFNR